MDLNLVRSAVTLLGLATFLGLMVWTWWPRQKPAMDAAAWLPFTDDTDDEGARRAPAPSNGELQ
jgi:cytochrome c oxidase cbb3-type subunit IV